MKEGYSESILHSKAKSKKKKGVSMSWLEEGKILLLQGEK